MEPTDHMGLLDPMNNMDNQANQDPAARPAARRTILAGAGSPPAPRCSRRSPTPPIAYVAAHHHRALLLSTRARHLVGRFAYGVTPALARRSSTTGAP